MNIIVNRGAYYRWHFVHNYQYFEKSYCFIECGKRSSTRLDMKCASVRRVVALSLG